MSLFSFEEVCNDCVCAKWHQCDECYNDRRSFCCCMAMSETKVDHNTGKCPDYKEIILPF